MMQLTSASSEVDLDSFHWMNRSFVVIVFSIGLGLLVAASAHAHSNSAIIKRSGRVAGLLAAFSYTLYLVHIPIIILLMHYGLLVRYDHLGLASLGTFLATGTLIIAVAFIIYCIFERQTPKIRQFLYRRLPPSQRRDTALVGST